MRTTIDEKSFHALQSTTPRMLTQGNNTQQNRLTYCYTLIFFTYT